MNESQRETLSAMLDNEADDLELRRLLKDAADPELLQAWQRYGAAQALLRGERLTRLGPNFREEISRRLANEPAPRGGRAAAGRGRRFVGKIAIAASVALAVFIGMQAGLNDGRDNPPAAQIAADAPSIQPRPVRHRQRSRRANTAGGGSGGYSSGARGSRSAPAPARIYRPHAIQPGRAAAGGTYPRFAAVPLGQRPPRLSPSLPRSCGHGCRFRPRPRLD